MTLRWRWFIREEKRWLTQSFLKLMPMGSVMSSNHLILCRPLLLLPSIFPSIRVFSNESALHTRWPKYIRVWLGQPPARGVDAGNGSTARSHVLFCLGAWQGFTPGADVQTCWHHLPMQEVQETRV